MRTMRELFEAEEPEYDLDDKEQTRAFSLLDKQLKKFALPTEAGERRVARASEFMLMDKYKGHYRFKHGKTRNYLFINAKTGDHIIPSSGAAFQRGVFDEATVDSPGSVWHGDEIISTYSRAQALEDGDLVDVSVQAREAGFRWPVAFTNALYSTIADIKKGSSQDLSGRMWDVLQVLKMKSRSGSGDRVLFTVKIGGRNHRLMSVAGPGDTPAPVITVGFPGDF